MIPVNTPLLDGNEREYLLECIDSGWISNEGPFVARFEQAFAETVGRKHGVACANGSGALDIAVAAAGIGPGDEVIMPTFTIISPAASVVRAGGVPVLVDSDPVTWNMNLGQIEAKISPRTKAILVVHLYGLPVDMDPLLEIAERHGLIVIEDAAEMHGQTYRGQPCGSFGLMSTFSFYPNKHITCGEGGMVVTDDDDVAEHCRRLRNLCFQPGRRFVHEELGWNYRMTNMQAAIGLAQLERLDAHVQRKRAMGTAYQTALSDTANIQLPLATTDYAENIYWVFGIVLGTNIDQDAAGIMQQLANQAIGTRPFFWPIHEQPVFLNQNLFTNESYPVAETLARRGFYLPSGLGLSTDDLSEVVTALRGCLPATR
ncbi:DegT/DnrJ/EryC1/StrS family aminotransferase [Allorhodopirellula heiligendammensis]|uniref:Pyridoxal phosphate-dependent aminotransferase EpsN n=1 Tax=Allorhodopirellula heiligendammensis TaxID=2714739 RepID=A0A5C6BYG4_9BACT|nr:DegT/DnrJ/EryC1/StrS family aminotransferase [Allorhodopirellula heiligendammensis]TWU16975.1 putative pyridoxal phosphate-dependent aminotransferase EpsN [Allorhodopirellula heiligendammensis]